MRTTTRTKAALMSVAAVATLALAACSDDSGDNASYCRQRRIARARGRRG